MILDRLLVRHKLNLLVAVPLAMVTLLMAVLLTGQVGRARLARATADTADVARRVSFLVEEVQRARLLAVAYLDSQHLDAELVSSDVVQVQFAAVADARTTLLHDLGTEADPVLRSAVRSAATVSDVGALVRAGRITDQAVVGSLNSVIDQLFQALHLDRQSTAGTPDAWTLSGLDTLLKTDEAASQSGALLLMAASNPVVRAQAAADAAVAQGLEREESQAFLRLATPSQQELFRQATQGLGAQRLADATAEMGLAGATTAQATVAQHVFSAVQSQNTLRQLVESSIAQEISLGARQAGTSALTGAVLLIGAGLLLLAGVVLLSLTVGRSVSMPLNRLTAAAGSVADVAAEELSNVTDDDAGPAAVRRLPELPVRSRDELGELAAVFNRVQAATAQLLERQVVSRRNVAAMFAGIGRRTSNLVGRQLALIDVLESAEEDPGTLGTLYRLDHLSTRLRRNASSLVVLSGERETGDEAVAVGLPDAVRAALGSIEDFQRVALSALPEVHLSPGAAADVVLILSELIENGVLFSPPHTSVEVSAWVTEDSRYAITIVDHGIGMPDQRLAEENVRLRQRERLDLAPTDVLGLFVVGRISRRHGIDVTLIPTPGGGVTARVTLPGLVFVDNPWSGAAVPVADPDRGHDAADAAAGPQPGRRPAAVSGPSTGPWSVAQPISSADRIDVVAHRPVTLSEPPTPVPPTVTSAPTAEPLWTGSAGSGWEGSAGPGWEGSAGPVWSAAADGTRPAPVAAARDAGEPEPSPAPGGTARPEGMPREVTSRVSEFPGGPVPPEGVTRRVPGTHWDGLYWDGLHGDGLHGDGLHGDGLHGDGPHGDGAVRVPLPGPDPVPQVDPDPDPDQPAHQVPGRIPASRIAAILDGAPVGFGAGPGAGPPDPEAIRRQVLDLEEALSGIGSQLDTTAPPSGSVVSPVPTAPFPPGVPPVPDPPPSAGVPPGFPPGRDAIPGAARGRTGPSGERLVRRVPGATLRELGVVLPEPAAPDPVPFSPGPVQIDADETLQAILDVDDAVRRARAQSSPDEGLWGTDDAVSRWGGREDGDGR